MSSDPLSSRIDLAESERQAAAILEAFRAGDARVLDHVRWNHPRFAGLSDAAIRAQSFDEHDAKLVLARRHSFADWPALLEHIDKLERGDPAVMRFEAAADAVVDGNLIMLRDLLETHPEIMHERSPRMERAPLLHYLAANGIEGYRQRTPPNVVEIARFLLEAGVEVDATSEAYGGGWTALGLVATSAWPRRAKLQIPLVDALLEGGASVDGVTKGLNLVGAALANGCPEAARALAQRGATLDLPAAAAVGTLEQVRSLAADASGKALDRALVSAGQAGTPDVAAWLLGRGADPAAQDDLGMTALHWAAGRGQLALVDLLLRRGASLEILNRFGGTVLESTLWFARSGDGEETAHADYPAVLERLIEAGARTDRFPEVRTGVSEVYLRAGKTPRFG